MRGGYQIIDLQNKPLTTGVGATFNGIYDKIKGTRKAILVTGVNIANTEYHDTHVDFIASGNTYTGIIYGKTITITNVDLVTITE